MNNAEYIAKHLEARGVTHVFELVGGMITMLIDALANHTRIKIVSMHHEQGAGFAAEGWARVTGVPGVALATSGPGATNLVTCIGSCYFDSIPCVFITGQVNRHEQKGDLKVRQLGFQETDIVSIVKPITKAAWMVNQPDELPRLLNEAFAVALSGRPGPVLLDVPMDVQRHPLDLQAVLPNIAPAKTSCTENQRSHYVDRLTDAIDHSERPMILAGGGIRCAGAVELFRSFVEKSNIPVVYSLLGADALPTGHPNRIGMIGSYGNRWSNLGLAESDLVLVLGSRLDIRQTGSDIKGFKGQRRFFHVDCDQGELNSRVPGCETHLDDLSLFLRSAASFVRPFAPHRPDWLKRLEDLRQQWPDTAEIRDLIGINPNSFMRSLSKSTSYAHAYVVDVGQHQMWAAQSLSLCADQRFLTSGGMGAMGFALPAAIGAALARGPVVVIAGDGGFQLNIQELQTIARERPAIKIVVINNRCHGMVRQFQQSYMNGRYHSTLIGYTAPDFVSIAKAYGINASRLEAPDNIERSLTALSENTSEPYLLEVIVDTMANAYPKLAFGRPFGEMEPESSPLAMEGT
jgi:acetolactate synthase-1/2/3 large subunit